MTSDRLECDVAVIGAGTTGLKAYKAAVANGADVVIVERGPGGSTCTRVGCMPSKLLIAAGRRAYLARHAWQFGVSANPISIEAQEVWFRVRQERNRFIASVLDEYQAIPTERVLHGEARFVGPDTIMVGDRQIKARKGIIIATGAHPVVPDVLKPVRHLVRTHETIFELHDLPESIAVLGSGPLGLELGQAFARLGVFVTLFDKGRTVGGLKDPETSKAALDALSGELKIVLGADVSATINDKGKARLSTMDGDIDVDLVLAATGRQPVLAGLDLERTCLSLDEHGTPLFDPATRRCGTSQIFIAGDADAWRPVLHEAARGGQIAGNVATGGSPAKPLPALSIAFTEPNLVEVGVAFDALPPDVLIGQARVADNGRAIVDGEDKGLVRIYAAPQGKLLGGSIAAPAGEHLGHLLALAIERGMDASSLEDQAWYHPTEEELLQNALRDLLSKIR